MKIRIESGYLVLDNGYEQKVVISLNFFKGSIYETPEIKFAVREYYDYCETIYDRPDMFWDPMRKIWLRIAEVGSVEHKQYELNQFIIDCRRNQKCLVN